MPVTWEIRDRVLVLTLVGNYDYEAPIHAVAEAMAEPAFQPGTMLLIDARQSTAKRSSDDFRERAIWMASLQTRGLGPRCALVINSQLHQFGVARMAAAHTEMRGMELEIFPDSGEAERWLTEGVRSRSAP